MKENTSKALADGAAQSILESSGAGSALFVINLCTSMAPIAVPGKTLSGVESCRLYQVMRVEDGRARYRLRLGFFAAKAHADSTLERVRDRYPTAFATCLSSEDQKFTRGYVPDTSSATGIRPAPPIAAAPQARPQAAQPQATSKSNPPVSKSSARAPTPAAAPKVERSQPAAQAVTTPSQAKQPARIEESAIVECTWEPPPLQPAAAKAAGAAARPTTVATVSNTQSVIKAQKTAKPATKAAPPATPATTAQAKPAGPARPDESPVFELTLEPEAAAPAKSVAAPAAAPFHVGKGADIPAVTLKLQNEVAKVPTSTAKAPAEPVHAGKSAGAATLQNTAAQNTTTLPAKPAAPSPAKPATSALAAATPTPSAAQPKAPLRPPAVPPVAAAPGKPQPRLPDLDSTQTIRALTKAELDDDSQEKWFAIQLAISEQPVNLDTMPRLDIFEAYRLYSVANAASGKILHSLRLGFFREQVSAEAVAGYLRTFFPDPTTTRISTAEYTRFKDPPARARPAAPDPQAQAKVIELSEARDRTKPIPTVTLEVTPSADKGRFDPGATGSFKPNATGSFKLAQSGNQSGAHKVLTPTLKPAAKAAPPIKRAARGSQKTSTTGKYRVPQRKSLTEALLEEARQVELSESGIHRLPKNDSLISRLVGKLTK